VHILAGVFLQMDAGDAVAARAAFELDVEMARGSHRLVVLTV